MDWRNETTRVELARSYQNLNHSGENKVKMEYRRESETREEFTILCDL